jgi:hypothetical protein
MKKITCIIFVLMFFGASAQNYNNRLIAYYPFMGNLKDYSGNDHDGIGHGGLTYTTDSFGNNNYALRLDGVNDWVQLPAIKLGKSFLISLMVKLDTTRPQMIISQSDTIGFAPNNQTFKFGFNLPKPVLSILDTGFTFRVKSTGNKCDSNGLLADSISVHMPSIGPGYAPLSPNKWYCLSFWYYSLHNFNGGYSVDVKFEGSMQGSAPTILDTCGSNLKIGKWWNSNPLYMKGMIDEVRIYQVDSMYPYSYIRDSVGCKLVPLIGFNKLDTGFCQGQLSTFKIPYFANNQFISGNVFTAQLSDSTSSFASPLSIGTKTSVSPDTILCTLPATLPTGNNYRVRIVSSHPYSVSADNRINIKLSAKPVVTAGSNSPLCALSDTLKLTGSSTISVVQYKWSGKTTSQSQNLSIPNVGTIYTGDYILKAQHQYCVSEPDTIAVLVKPIPANLLPSYNTSVCQNDTLRLAITTTTSGVSFTWSGPASYSSSIQNPRIPNAQLAQSGKYYINATTGNGCYAKDSINVLIKPLPANFNASANTICEGSTLFLSGATTSTGVSFAWIGPNGFTDTLQNPNIPSATMAANGSYILIGTLNGCTIRDTVFANVFPIPAKPTVIANTPVCVGQDLALQASTTTTGSSYAWTSTTGYTSSLQNPVRASATTAMAGKYYVTATANGCTSKPDSVNVVVNLAPVINMYPSPNDSICQGATVTFVSSTANTGSIFQRAWYRNNTLISGAAAANYSTSAAADYDEYYVTVTASGVCANPYTDTSNKITMRVFPWLPATVSITANPATTVPSGTMINFAATPVNGGNTPTYQWTRNGTNIVGALSAVWGAPNLSNNDEICVNMSSSYLCPNPKTAKSNCIKVSIETTGIRGLSKNNGISVFPNPVKDVLTIQGAKQGSIIALYDATGRLITKQTVIAMQSVIHTSALPTGIYTLTILSDNDIYQYKITKE